MDDSNIEHGGYVEPNQWGVFNNEPDTEIAWFME